MPCLLLNRDASSLDPLVAPPTLDDQQAPPLEYTPMAPTASSPVIQPSVQPSSQLSILRKIIIPDSFVQKFIEVSESNSAINIETLGLIGGKDLGHCFMVSHLVIPSQIATHETCEQLGHELVSETFLKENIIQLGWIHTHPSFDVFPSSVDMHNQYKYQKMLPETMAIVYSKRFDKTDYLRLSELGMTEIGGCNLENFHQHSNDVTAQIDHMMLAKNLNVTTIDLRN